MRFAPIAIVIAICAVPALADSADPDDKRFSFHKVDDGFLRLDGRTGAVALCARPESGWACHAVPDERSALEGEIERLASENAALKSALLERGGRLPELPPRPPADIGADKSVPSDSEVDQIMTFMEKLWHRMLDMIANVQRDFANKS
jgi:hypothetical protein